MTHDIVCGKNPDVLTCQTDKCLTWHCSRLCLQPARKLDTNHEFCVQNSILYHILHVKYHILFVCKKANSFYTMSDAKWQYLQILMASTSSYYKLHQGIAKAELTRNGTLFCWFCFPYIISWKSESSAKKKLTDVKYEKDVSCFPYDFTGSEVFYCTCRLLKFL